MKMGHLTREPIHIHDFIRAAPESNFRSGAGVFFLGMIRDHSQERKVLYLEYEAHEEMAERILHDLAASALTRWPLEEIRLLHRLGRIGLGEIAVAIFVQSVHRDEAYQASRCLIEEIKHQAPIWKKEYFSDGTSEWSLCSEDHVDLSRSL